MTLVMQYLSLQYDGGMSALIIIFGMGRPDYECLVLDHPVICTLVHLNDT